MKEWFPPKYSLALAKEIEPDWVAEDFPITCFGHWQGGSGGHRIYVTDPPCDKPVVWWHPSDPIGSCEQHINKNDKRVYLKLWRQWRYEHILSRFNIK